jgi:hypothetical protein
MKKRILKLTGGASLVLVAIAAVAQIWVSAQVQSTNDQGLVGSWDVTVTPRDCETGNPAPFPPVFSAVQTYNLGGTMLASVLPGPGVITLEGHGVWAHRKGLQYSSAIRFLRYNQNGTYAGKDVVRDLISVDISGDTFTGTGTVDILDPNGTMIFRGCATSIGTRFE